ncbi:MAG TPA: RNA polymerase sigma factor [Thermoflexia bacterium]|nr:RNA polymerase sigma factor [Thermoflexia bacterium]
MTISEGRALGTRNKIARSQDVPSEHDLWQRAIAGDREAFIRLIERHLDSLYRFAAREIRYRRALGDLEPDEVTPEEVVSETVLAALRELARRPCRASFKGWLRHLALQIIKRWARRSRERRYHERIHLEDVLPSSQLLFAYYQPDAALTWEDVLPDRSTPMPEEALEIREAWEELEAMVNRLPADEREVFTLRAIEGLRFDEIAAMRQQRIREVKALYRQAREVLREQLADRMVARIT